VSFDRKQEGPAARAGTVGRSVARAT